MSKIEAIRGMGDLLPDDAVAWRAVEGVLTDIAAAYGYREMRVPVVERTELFRRSIGEVTDIVEKEMYTFADRNDVSLTLRPEATAGIVRAAISNGMLHNQRHKLWTIGPMFRYEKPQKGRTRQFHQFDIEALGYAGPDVDAEIIVLTARVWRALGIDAIELQLNSLGTPESRVAYREAVREYFSQHVQALDAEARQRLERNPLRLLDSKDPTLGDIIAAAPDITQYLDAESAQHLETLCRLLDDAGIAFRLNPRLVRGLDYYSRTVFEWVTDRLGAQGTVCAGGRYDGLVAQLGGAATPAIGCALGLERLVELYRVCGNRAGAPPCDVYMVAVGDGVFAPAFRLAESLRDAVPGLRLELNCDGGSFKSQMKRADKSGATLALILGEDERDARAIGIKPLRNSDEQRTVAWSELNDEMRSWFGSLDRGHH